MTGVRHHTELLVEMGSQEIFARASLELHNPPDLCLLTGQDYRLEPPCLAVVMSITHRDWFPQHRQLWVEPCLGLC
jgi:hypothetical protein